ncbi:MAG: steroid 5-alpha reductase family enzyme [Mariniblastus sp.]|jgi:steroid 5-alpha reductase family enzyme
MVPFVLLSSVNPMNLLLLAAIGLSILFLQFSILWLVQYRIGNSAIVDVFWGGTVATVGVLFCLITDGDVTRRWVTSVLISIWAIRLGSHLFVRWKSHAEDARYADLKLNWGENAQVRMFRFYQMQAAGAFLFTIPLLLAGSAQSAFGWIDGVGIAIWVIATVGESLADVQLARFRKVPSNRGEVCRDGLWRYSRHPNYFFEWLQWWTYVAFAMTAPWGWLSILAPIAMWFFLNRVTGIPLTEIQSIKSRGDKYRHYQTTTNAFFPWFPSQD